MILNLITLSLGIPAGFLIAWLARDELIQGRSYIRVLFTAAFLTLLIFNDEVIVLTTGFVIVIAYISILKSHDRKWAVERKR